MPEQTYKKMPILGIDKTNANIPLPSGFGHVRYAARYNLRTAMNRIVSVVVQATTVGEAAAAAARMEQFLARQEQTDHLPHLTSVDITAVDDLGAIIDQESGGLVFSEVTL